MQETQQHQAHVVRRGDIMNVKPPLEQVPAVSRNSTAQLDRKRAKDRESQRAYRERTKENIEKFERQIEEQRRQIEAQNLSLEWMKQRYSQLESEMHAQGAVMTLMLNATPSSQTNDYSDNIGSMRWADYSDASEEIRVKASETDFTPGYSPINVSFPTLPVFEWPTGNITDARCMKYT